MSKHPKMIPEPHPGEILLEEFIKPAGITPYRVAKDSGISQSTMTQIVNGKRGISIETALRLATYFKTTPALWLNLQRNYELRMAEQEILPAIRKQVKPLELASA
ncbi:HigA family addiction module antitoxin [Ruficoccus sp. ZRK36]|uniref:HigA family addiction module antitoxin n=1 Tax=Ruficoccus sp. ZRK36 TaxID=2866311 RepID=UPI001C73BAED|nr:HigA family addiction module antitoxin [Ruficoccus sp. ZRK36]QYY34912.1 HigA family addiction module antidote protein [Ruficoccus sp. ZRK36]